MSHLDKVATEMPQLASPGSPIKQSPNYNSVIYTDLPTGREYVDKSTYTLWSKAVIVPAIKQ